MNDALLIVSFGTSVPEARASISAVEDALQAAAPRLPCFRAFTSPTIRRILAGRGETVDSLPEALERLAAHGFQRVIIQPTHMLYGIEYDKMKKTVLRLQHRFSSLLFGKPLLSDSDDLRRLSACLLQHYPQEPQEALIWMGHGSSHFAKAVYPAMQTAFHVAGRDDCYVGTVEGWPTIETVKNQLRAGSFSSAHLVPLMLVAGDHAKNDMAGTQPDSWKNQLSEEGLRVRCTTEGLGLLPEVREMYCDHLKELL